MSDPTRAMVRQRVRIRFGKDGDLRWISHRDLVRLFERLLRRAGLKLGMSQGFHPKARMSFPSALALGVAGADEVMELELAETGEPEALRQRMARHAPPGLSLRHLELLEPGRPKAQVTAASYELAIPDERRAGVAQAARRLWDASSHPVERSGRAQPIDVRGGLEALELRDGRLRIRLRVERTASVRPREVLAALGCDDLLAHGAPLVRCGVRLSEDESREDESRENQTQHDQRP